MYCFWISFQFEENKLTFGKISLFFPLLQMTIVLILGRTFETKLVCFSCAIKTKQRKKKLKSKYIFIYHSWLNRDVWIISELIGASAYECRPVASLQIRDSMKDCAFTFSFHRRLLLPLIIYNNIFFLFFVFCDFWCWTCSNVEHENDNHWLCTALHWRIRLNTQTSHII